MNLNIDCKWQIIENMDFLSQISLAETNKHFSSLVGDILKRKLANKWIILVRPHFEDLDEDAYESPTNIEIFDLQIFSKLLTKFGHLISKLSIEIAHASQQEVKLIYKMVNLYCSETLTKFRIRNSGRNVLDQFTKPFEKVEEIFIRGEFEKLDGSQLHFSQIFPALRRMHFGKITVLDRKLTKWVDCNEFPHLEHLFVEIFNRYDSQCRFTNELTKKFIKSHNPQIRSLELFGAPLKLLKFIGDEVKNLEILVVRLHLNSTENGADYDIHFENVKVFKIIQAGQRLPDNILTFEQLEELETDAFVEDFEKWLKFIENNRNLWKLNVSRPLDCVEIQQITSINTNLTDISLSCQDDVKIENIVRFIENGKRLKRVNLELSSGRSLEFSDSIINYLREHFEKWTINRYGQRIRLEKI